MYQEYNRTHTDLLERLAGELNEFANSLLLTEEERSYLLNKASMEARGEDSSEELENLGENVGPYTQFFLDEVIERGGCKSGVFIGFTAAEIEFIKQGMEVTRNDDLSFTRPDPHYF